MSDPSSPTPQSVPDAGWYPDPAGGGGTRWWDGKGWTDHVRPDPSGPPSTASTATTASAVSAPNHPTAPDAGEVPWWATSGTGTAPGWWKDAEPTGGSTWNADPSTPWGTPGGGPGGPAAQPTAPYATPRRVGRPPNAPDATKAMWLGILSLLCCSLLGPWAIYTGVQVRFRIRVSNGRLGGEGYAIAGIILGTLSCLLFCYSLYRAATGDPLWTLTTTRRP